MIKNIIFDVGNVLVSFDWETYFKNLGITEDVFERVADATVRSSLWNEYDRSSLSDEELLDGFIKQSPKDEQQIRAVWDNIGKVIACYPYTKTWISELKEKGYKIYLLSNYPKRTYELTKEELSFEHQMDGGLFSFEVKHIKPEREIYQALMDKYNLVPEECVFLDDNKNNINAATAFGMEGILFTSQEQAIADLKKLNIQ